MSPRRMFRGRARWMSAVAVLAVGGVLAGTMLASAAGPSLPKRTPAQLLVAMRNARPPAAMTAVITENANLGFPSLPNIAGLNSSVFSAASALTGTHTVDVWYDGPRHVRIAMPVSFGETDLRVNGNQVWLWNSHGQTATHYILPARAAVPAGPGFPVRPGLQIRPGLHGLLPPRCVKMLRSAATSRSANPAKVHAIISKCLSSLKFGHRQVVVPNSPMTPQQAAEKFLAAIGHTTKVTVAGSTTVAGRPAYQLVVAPRTSQSLISQIVIAVDSQTYLPLQLAVFGRDTSSPAFQVGFTSLSFARPAASNFTFTPPAGAHVKTEKIGQLLPGGGLLPMAGIPAPLPGPFTSQRFLPHGRIAKLPALRRKSMVRLGGAAAGSKTKAVAWYVGAMQNPPGQVMASQSVVTAMGPLGTLHGGQVLGSGWLSVAVLPVGNALSAPVQQKVPLIAGGPPQAGSLPQGGQIQALLRILLNSATRVHGTWGSGRLLQTTLFSALITNHGKVLIGAVTPSVLYADAAKVK